MRIRTLLRRASGTRSVVRLAGGAMLLLEQQRVLVEEHPVTLTMREWQLLECLVWPTACDAGIQPLILTSTGR